MSGVQYVSHRDTVHIGRVEQVHIRRLMGSTDQADPSSFYFKIDGTTLILFFLPPRLVAGPRKLQKLTTSKIKYEHFVPKILIPH